MDRVWEEIATPAQREWLKTITEGGARMLWDGRLHKDFISGIRRFGASNGTAKKAAKEIMEAITYNKIQLVDERHKIKHKETEKTENGDGDLKTVGKAGRDKKERGRRYNNRGKGKQNDTRRTSTAPKR